mgnify:CR=1 FL=1
MLAENAYQDNSEISFDYTDTDSLKQYLREISKFELLSDEEVALKWLNNGALPTDTVKNLFSKAGIMKKYAESKVKKDK